MDTLHEIRAILSSNRTFHYSIPPTFFEKLKLPSFLTYFCVIMNHLSEWQREGVHLFPEEQTPAQ